MNGIIVYGPQGCGKSTNASLLMNKLGMTRVVDEYVLGTQVQENTLYLSNVDVNGALHYQDVISNCEAQS